MAKFTPKTHFPMARLNYLFSFLSLATTNIDCFLTKKFVKTKKFEKRNIMAGFRQLYFFLHGFPILGICDSWSLPHQGLLVNLNSHKGIRQVISQIDQFPGILAMPPLDKDIDLCTLH